MPMAPTSDKGYKDRCERVEGRSGLNRKTLKDDFPSQDDIESGWRRRAPPSALARWALQGYLAHKKPPPPLGPPYCRVLGWGGFLLATHPCRVQGLGFRGPGFGFRIQPSVFQDATDPTRNVAPAAQTVVAGEGGACSLPEVGGVVDWPCRQRLARLPPHWTHRTQHTRRFEPRLRFEGPSNFIFEDCDSLIEVRRIEVRF